MLCRKVISHTCQVHFVQGVLRAAVFPHTHSLHKKNNKIKKSYPLLFTCVFREADAECRLLDLLRKQILLVEEEDDGSVNEELVVADGVKQHQGLVHAILQRRTKETEIDGRR